MPELPEVRNVAMLLNEKVCNKKIKFIDVFKPKMLKGFSVEEMRKKLIHATITKISNVGKYLTFFFDNNVVLVSHLRMEGKYHTTEWENKKHDYVTFTFTDNSKLYYNDSRQFGTFDLRTKENYLIVLPLSKLGKEAQNIDVDKFYHVLSKKSTAIKTVLLDQETILGIGNIYANEILWSAKIHPGTPSKNLDVKTLKNILEITTDILDHSTRLGGTTIHSFAALDKREGQFQAFLNVHGKENEPCSRCGTMIKKIKINGRGTYFCPKEQVLKK